MNNLTVTRHQVFDSQTFLMSFWIGFTLLANNSYACDIQVSPVDFGVYTAIQATIAQGQINVSDCDNKPIRISLGAGEYAESTFNWRYLSADDNNKIAYHLYTNQQYTTVWGDGTQNTTFVTGNAGRYLVYGKVEAGQSVSSGEYHDNVQIIIEW